MKPRSQKWIKNASEHLVGIDDAIAGADTAALMKNLQKGQWAAFERNTSKAIEALQDAIELLEDLELLRDT